MPHYHNHPGHADHPRKDATSKTLRDLPAVPDKPVRIDCGSGRDYGICPVCRRGHGYIVFHKS